MYPDEPMTMKDFETLQPRSKNISFVHDEPPRLPYTYDSIYQPPTQRSCPHNISLHSSPPPVRNREANFCPYHDNNAKSKLSLHNQELKKSVRLVRETFNLTLARIAADVVHSMEIGDRAMRPVVRAAEGLNASDACTRSRSPPNCVSCLNRTEKYSQSPPNCLSSFNKTEEYNKTVVSNHPCGHVSRSQVSSSYTQRSHSHSPHSHRSPPLSPPAPRSPSRCPHTPRSLSTSPNTLRPPPLTFHAPRSRPGTPPASRSRPPTPLAPRSRSLTPHSHRSGCPHTPLITKTRAPFTGRPQPKKHDCLGITSLDDPPRPVGHDCLCVNRQRPCVADIPPLPDSNPAIVQLEELAQTHLEDRDFDNASVYEDTIETKRIHSAPVGYGGFGKGLGVRQTSSPKSGNRNVCPFEDDTSASLRIGSAPIQQSTGRNKPIRFYESTTKSCQHSTSVDPNFDPGYGGMDTSQLRNATVDSIGNVFTNNETLPDKLEPIFTSTKKHSKSVRTSPPSYKSSGRDHGRVCDECSLQRQRASGTNGKRSTYPDELDRDEEQYSETARDRRGRIRSSYSTTSISERVKETQNNDGGYYGMESNVDGLQWVPLTPSSASSHSVDAPIPTDLLDDPLDPAIQSISEYSMVSTESTGPGFHKKTTNMQRQRMERLPRNNHHTKSDEVTNKLNVPHPPQILNIDRSFIERKVDDVLLPTLSVEKAYDIACQLNPVRRMIGEICYQLDCHIVDKVFSTSDISNLRRRSFYGSSPKTIPAKIRTESVDTQGNSDPKREVAMRYRWNSVLQNIGRWGYQLNFHSDFSQRMINMYKLVQTSAERRLLDDYMSRDLRVIRCLIYRTIPDTKILKHVLILFDCLCILSYLDELPLFRWF